MSKKECIAMLLAGGQGSRLYALTEEVAKPAVSFGGKFRIIDFALSNCGNSEITTVGVLTQYKPYLLHSYIGSGSGWNLDERGAGISILPPYSTKDGGSWYAGTADAIKQNIGYIENNDPEFVLILSGDHLYRMDYQEMLAVHKQNNADLTVAVMPVAWEEASRFGILSTDDEGRVTKFSEKPANPDSNLASMGIYIFSKQVLIDFLEADAKNEASSHDFGNDIIPAMLADKKRIFTYKFEGFWKDVGTLESYYDTSMDLLGENPVFSLRNSHFPIMSNTSVRPPHLIGWTGSVKDSIVTNGCRVYGTVEHSIISTDCFVAGDSLVKDSILLPGARVEEGARVVHAIVGERSVIAPHVRFGQDGGDIALVGNDKRVEGGK